MITWLLLTIPFLWGELVQPSRPQTYELKVVAMDGGSVVSNPGGLMCRPICNVEIEAGSQVTLLSGTDLGYTFAGWSGACAGQPERCTLTMDRPLSTALLVDPIP